MLVYNGFDLAWTLALTSLMAVVMWWRYPRLWPPCIGVLLTAACIAVYLPIRIASGELDGFIFEVIMFGGVLGVVHFGSVLIIVFDRGDR